MTEHAHDPIPHEEQEPEAPSLDTGITEGDSLVVGGSVAFVAPNATVTGEQLVAACASGRWEHENASTALWLNTSFAPAGREMADVILDLNAHGVYVVD